MLFFILLVFPLIEILVMIQVADKIGWWLLLWLILSAFAGWTLIKEEKMAMVGRLFSSLQTGASPVSAIFDSLRTLLAGVLLILPGIVSDFIAILLLLLPRSKRQTQAAPRSQNPTGGFGAGEEVIIEGEYKREEEKRVSPSRLNDS
jgi:UPF0716 protein FxsA